MFEAKTVIILGAGASWHYGYPTGEELVKEVIKKAKTASGYFSNPNVPRAKRPRIVSGDDPAIPEGGDTGLQRQWGAAANKCQDLIERLIAVDPLVIDYFIGDNRHLEDIAKLCIAWVILEREFVALRYRVNENREQKGKINDNWYRFLLYRLTSGCQDGKALLRNKITFVTFNYDVSLEIELYRGLGHSLRFSDYADEFITQNDRILHVYGRLRKDPPWHLVGADWEVFGPVSRHGDPVTQKGPPQFWTDARALLDHAFETSQGLETIAPEKALAGNEIPDHIEKAREVLREAECIYILGYGFDPLNSELLKLREHLKANSGKTVMFTNYKNSGVVNKNAARLFGLPPNELLPEGGRIIPVGNSVYEKSVKDVYGALALDFDAPEERPRGS
jgi:hypothetical protein